jgi:hypothetical protein
LPLKDAASGGVTITFTRRGASGERAVTTQVLPVDTLAPLLADSELSLAEFFRHMFATDVPRSNGNAVSNLGILLGGSLRIT